MTTVKYVTGDLFSVGVPAIGHGVNCHGVMGSGIAPLFRKRYPDMYVAYKQECANGYLTLGSIMPWEGDDGVTVINMATQYAPGPNASLSAIRAALESALRYCEANNIPEFAIPRIGAGIGGLKWDDVRKVIERVASEFPIQVTVVSLPGADG